MPVNVLKGDQFKPEFLAISPYNRMPAIVDHHPKDGGNPFLRLRVRYHPAAASARRPAVLLASWAGNRVEVMEWLFWQMGGLGPMAGQNHHFSRYAPKKIPYAVERYVKETNRLYGVLNKRLSDRKFIAKSYSIADMAVYPWIVPYEQRK